MSGATSEHTGRVKGIDVSDWQHEIDWGAVADAGIVFAVIRGAHGVTPDKHGRRNLREGQAARIRTASYQYMMAGSARAQADVFLVEIAESPIDLCPFLDIEDEGLDHAKTADIALEWLRIVEEQTGRRPGVYINLDCAARFGITRREEFAGYPLWVAHWGVAEPHAPMPWASDAWVIWQHGLGQKGAVRGIGTSVDLDVALSLEALEALGPPAEPAAEAGDSPAQNT